MECTLAAARLIDDIKSTISFIDEAHYGQSLALYNGSSMGQHFRHIHDFFSCLVRMKENTLDYTLRERNEDIENSKDCAIKNFNDVQTHLKLLDENTLIKVNTDYETVDGHRPFISSSVARELMYVYDHAVHHLAIINIGLKELYPERSINQELGVAASTLRFKQHSHVHEG